MLLFSSWAGHFLLAFKINAFSGRLCHYLRAPLEGSAFEGSDHCCSGVPPRDLHTRQRPCPL